MKFYFDPETRVRAGGAFAALLERRVRMLPDPDRETNSAWMPALDAFVEFSSMEDFVSFVESVQCDVLTYASRNGDMYPTLFLFNVLDK